ncbi:GMC oxidoreductase [Aulographum hederae CBS 113979]|uniref:GMC oxidoreductase n=1 Tax=Aulographum hederae CBS 113979 TaxID=1176131 RepID=A0A6G1GQS2_9PEZI|nr:GMC oxidoreductase [Aulographum hederae CBS 113979]
MNSYLLLSLSIFSSTLAAPYPRSSPSCDLTSQWDTIVVGAGPAGIIIADRMSEAGKKTLLIEGGGPSYGITGGTQRPNWLSGTNLSRVDVPGLYKSIFSDQGNLTCSGVTNAFGGCTVGGSSAVNAGLYFQPPDSDFDDYFPDAWKAADMRPAIARLLSRIPAVDNPSPDGIRYLQSGYTAARKWLVDNAGYEEVSYIESPNDKSKVFGRPVFDYDRGKRGGPATTYLQTSLRRSNFCLLTHARVKRVVRMCDTASEMLSDHASGVIVTINGVDHTINLGATAADPGRVILSGGALQSPQLLMTSGIGPPGTLTRLAAAGLLGDLPPSSWINNTAVGDRLFDNPNTFIELSGPGISSYTHSYASPPLGDRSLYLTSFSGPYAFASQTSAFWDSIVHGPGDVVGLQGTIDTSGYGAFTNGSTITLNVYGTSGLLSTGRVELDERFIPGASAETYYSHPRDADDIATFIHGLFAHLPASGLTPLNIAPNATLAQIRDYITTPSPYARGQVNHWSSSCRFGACVDAETRVRGMRNLYVVDASVVPPLTVNPQMGVMVVAERAAERILGVGGRGRGRGVERLSD